MTKAPNNFIHLTLRNGNPVYVNINNISYFSKLSITSDDYQNGLRAHILPLGHNNGGFSVKETYEEVIELINKSQGVKNI